MPTANGTRISLRRVDAEDRGAFADLFARLSPESRRRRFLYPKRELTARELTFFTDIDHVNHEAIAAVDKRDGSTVGVARYVRDAHRPDAAEVAIEVADAFQMIGIGTALASLTIERARANGLAILTATTQWENHAARRLLRRLGFRARKSRGGEIEHEHELGHSAPAFIDATARAAGSAARIVGLDAQLPVSKMRPHRDPLLRGRGRAMNGPRDLVAEIEAWPRMPRGSEERFAGYGVMGLPFSSGHILALRRFPASSVGPGYRSVWHRDPNGRWTFSQDVASAHACSRDIGPAVAEVAAATIDIDWGGPRQFSVTVTNATRRLDWSVTLTASAVTRAMSGIAALLPEAIWRQRWFLTGMGAVAGPMLGAGKVSLVGRTPNGQRFAANPRSLWLITDSRAKLDGTDLGALGPAPVPGRMADFLIPQRGVFAVGEAFFR